MGANAVLKRERAKVREAEAKVRDLQRQLREKDTQLQDFDCICRAVFEYSVIHQALSEYRTYNKQGKLHLLRAHPGIALLANWVSQTREKHLVSKMNNPH